MTLRKIISIAVISGLIMTSTAALPMNKAAAETADTPDHVHPFDGRDGGDL